MNEQKIREAFEEAKKKRMEMPEVFKADLQYYLFKSGYLALLNELELDHYDRGYFRNDIPLYRLPEGVEKP